MKAMASVASTSGLNTPEKEDKVFDNEHDSPPPELPLYQQRENYFS